MDQEIITWQQDSSDYSWISRDANGTMYRVSEVYVEGVVEWRWALAWQEHNGLRISGRTFPTVDEAKTAAEELWSRVPDTIAV